MNNSPVSPSSASFFTSLLKRGLLSSVYRSINFSPVASTRNNPFWVAIHFLLAPSTCILLTSCPLNKYPAKFPLATTGHNASQPVASKALSGHSITATPSLVPTQINPFRSLAIQSTSVPGIFPFPVPLLYLLQRSSPVLSILPRSSKQSNPFPNGETIHFWSLSSISSCAMAFSVRLNGGLKFFQLPSAFLTFSGCEEPKLLIHKFWWLSNANPATR